MRAGQALCGLVTSPGPRDTWLPALLSTTLALYTAGLSLPGGAGNDADPFEEEAVSLEEWLTLYQGISAMIGDDRWYIAADPGLNLPGSLENAAVGDVADDLCDIYRDILPGLRYWEAGGEEGHAAVVWEWRFGFITHWGRHAIAALGLLHFLVMRDGLASLDDLPHGR